MPRRGPTTAILIVLLPLLTLAPALAQEAEPLATVGGEPITAADVEESIRPQLDELEKQRKQLLENALGPAIDRKLVDLEAAARGITADELLNEEVTAKVEPITDEDVDAWYEENRGQIRPGQTKEQLSGQIKNFLYQDRGQGIYRGFLRTLRAKYETTILFEPEREEIELSSATWKGSEDAPVTLVEFSDFQCPACRGFNPILEQLLEIYPEDVRVAFLQFPLRSIHPQAQGAAEASLCARDAGKFWELHDAMFANQRNLSLDALKASAREVGIDGDAFDACLDSNQYAATVQADVDQAGRLRATGTPSVFVNGRRVTPGRVPTLEILSNLVEDELRRAPGGQ